ncbi:MAG: 50S ribosomal protein L32 [Patescibacteria group bacterium]
MRHTRAHTANRRSHHALVAPRLSKCAKCGAAHLRHRVCLNCGTYRGRVVVDITKKLAKKTAKKKQAERSRR